MPRSVAISHPQLALFSPPPSPPLQSKPLAAAAASQLWMALYFPDLALAVLRDECVTAWCVVHEVRGQQQVYAASGLAQQYGVDAGMALTAAYALCPELEVEWRDEGAESAHLLQMAEWAYQFSSIVSMDEQSLLLEVGGSLKLFGGLDAIQTHIQESLKQQCAAYMSIAPTPQSALLLARCGIERVIERREALKAELGLIAIDALPVNDKQRALFKRLGVRCLRDVWRLPSEGLNKRFGITFVDYLDRLLGRKTEPRLAYQSAPEFSCYWSFPIETDNTVFIFHGLEKLVPRLVQFMRLRELALSRLQIVFYHAQQSASYVDVAMQKVSSDEPHLLNLVQEYLDKTDLIAPVIEIELRANEFFSAAPDNESLFEDAVEQGAEWQQLLDQLQARLGECAIRTLSTVVDHRPEKAWCYGESDQNDVFEVRPLWLLPQPLLLNTLYGFELQSEVERIEGGWWDGLDIRRDYFAARDRQGRRLWLFCDLKTEQWYLHGLFG